MYGLQVEKINLKSDKEKLEVRDFLNRFELDYDNDVDYSIVIRYQNEIMATCSKAGSILKCFAVSPDFQGEGIAATLVTALTDRLFEEGKYHSFIFTKPKNIEIFTSLGYKLVYNVEQVALLESGMYDIEKYLENLAGKFSIDRETPKAALVMNCNPFTLGHQYLIEAAARGAEEVLVFMVEEDRSLFPFSVRYDLVKKGTEHLKNVKIIPGGEYIISSATFPAYFLREESEKLKAYTALDAGVFGKYFCQKFNIKTRYVGEEPYCKVTNAYNESLEETLSKFGVELKVIERRKNEAQIISASLVRNLIKYDKMEEVKKVVPKVTYDFLNTASGKEIVEKIKKSNSPH